MHGNLIIIAHTVIVSDGSVIYILNLLLKSLVHKVKLWVALRGG